jgi:hypothetical protein
MRQSAILEDAHLELGRLVDVLQDFAEQAKRPEQAYYQAALQCLLDAQNDIAPRIDMPRAKAGPFARRLSRR